MGRGGSSSLRVLILVFFSLGLYSVAYSQSGLPYDIQKSADGKLDPTALEENYQYLYSQIMQQKATVSNLQVNGVVDSVGASAPLCSSGGTNPQITFCGTLSESQVTNLSSDISNLQSIQSNHTTQLSNLAASTTTLSASTVTLQNQINALPVGNLTDGPFAASLFPSTAAWTNKDNNWSVPQTFQSSGTINDANGLKVTTVTASGLISATTMTATYGMTVGTITTTATGNNTYAAKMSTGIFIGNGGCLGVGGTQICSASQFAQAGASGITGTLVNGYSVRGTGAGTASSGSLIDMGGSSVTLPTGSLFQDNGTIVVASTSTGVTEGGNNLVYNVMTSSADPSGATSVVFAVPYSSGSYTFSCDAFYCATACELEILINGDTGSNYYSPHRYSSTDIGGVTNEGSGATTYCHIFRDTVASAAGVPIAFDMDFHSLGYRSQMTFSSSYQQTAVTNDYYINGACRYLGSSDIKSLTLTEVSGTFTGHCELRRTR